jgi:DNA polymerase IIIc chi subunit
VALNLAQAPVSAQPHLIKLIEVVGTKEADVLAARARWRGYAAQGWAPEKFVART